MVRARQDNGTNHARLASQGNRMLERRRPYEDHRELSEKIPRVTVRQLLTHTSGVPDYFDESVMTEYAELWVELPNYRIRRFCDLLPLFLDKPMMYPPGERFQYNNSGYVLLGLAIEAVSGLPFDCYLQEKVFAPAGMERTGYYELDHLPEGCASAYILDKATGEYYTNIYSVDAKGSGAGGAFTTVGDVRRLWRALMDGKLLGPESRQQMLREQVKGKWGSYGYGSWFRSRRDRLVPFFQGSDPGVSFISSHDEVAGQTITVVSNFGDEVWEIEAKIDALLHDGS